MGAGRWSLRDAKLRFSAVVEAALNGELQVVTDRGRPAVVVLSIAQYERLGRRRSLAPPSFVEHLMNMPKDDGAFERIDLE